MNEGKTQYNNLYNCYELIGSFCHEYVHSCAVSNDGFQVVIFG
jgi:hypothetical protein